MTTDIPEALVHHVQRTVVGAQTFKLGYIARKAMADGGCAYSAAWASDEGRLSPLVLRPHRLRPQEHAILSRHVQTQEHLLTASDSLDFIATFVEYEIVAISCPRNAKLTADHVYEVRVVQGSSVDPLDENGLLGWSKVYTTSLEQQRQFGTEGMWERRRPVGFYVLVTGRRLTTVESMVCTLTGRAYL